MSDFFMDWESDLHSVEEPEAGYRFDLESASHEFAINVNSLLSNEGRTQIALVE